jgi:hypothetical protein
MKKILELALGIVTSGFLEIGSIATAAQAGADFSLQLIWTIVLGGVIEKGVSMLGLVTLSFVVGAVLINPPWSQVAQSALPSLPQHDSVHYWFVAVSILGATISPYLYFAAPRHAMPTDSGLDSVADLRRQLMDLIRDCLDKQLEDSNKRRMGRVDGIILDIEDDRQPHVAYVEVGVKTLLNRLSPRLADVVAGWLRKLGIPTDPYRIALRCEVDELMPLRREQSPS